MASGWHPGTSRGAAEPGVRETGRLQTLEFLEEEVVPRTTTVDTGEVVVRKHVVTEMRTVQVPVRREVVQVYRLGPAGEPVEATAQPTGQTRPSAESFATEPGGVIWDSTEEEEVVRLPLLEEEAVVTTRLVVREEVVVRRLRYRGRRRVAEEVRREEPRLQAQGRVSAASPEEQQSDRFKEDS
jgi:stress response protein YsnF